MKQLVEKLKEYNLKVTPQRLAIYSMLYKTNTHPSAESIHQALSESHPSMSLATVYKTLGTLNKAGLIQEINVGEDSFRYDANSESHPHMVCTECHEIFDLPPIAGLESLKHSISAQTDFEIHREQLYFFGSCKSCRNPAQKVPTGDAGDAGDVGDADGFK